MTWRRDAIAVVLGLTLSTWVTGCSRPAEKNKAQPAASHDTALQGSSVNSQSAIGSASGTPADKGQTTRVVSIAAGSNNTFAILSTGKVKAWGANSYGSIGLGKAASVAEPTEVPELEGATQISTADWHSCAVMKDATARCWGRNFGGRLGDGTSKDRLSPTAVVDIKGVKEIRVGGGHSCARVADDSAKCWGLVISGENNRPKPVPKLSSVSGITLGGDHTCAWHPDGTASCWDLALGREFNYGDAVNDGDGNMKPATMVPGIKQVKQMSLSGTHVCAVTEDGALYCWGDGTQGQLGDGKFGGEPKMDDKGSSIPGYVQFKPHRVPDLGGVVRVAAGEGFTCAILSSANVLCWGANGAGQLGVGDKKQRPKPAIIDGLSDVVDLSAGDSHVCALTKDGSVWCWGSGSRGQLGDGQKASSHHSLVPHRVAL